MSSLDRREVYVTGIGRVPLCKRCGNPLDRCRCQQPKTETPRTVLPQDGWVRLARERKGRGGKIVTIVGGLPQDDTRLAELAQILKKFLGAGGTIEGGQLVIQGDHRDRLEPKLVALGYKVKRVGG
jgi:translation initiation factor 1